MPKKLTNEEFVKRCEERKGYTPLTKYVNNSTPVLFRHDTCGREFYMKPVKFFIGQGCNICKRKAAATKFSQAGKESFYKALDTLGLKLVDENYVYKNNRGTVEVQCKKCGNIQSSWITNLISGHGCQRCGWERSKKANPPEDIVPKLKRKAPDWELVGEYVNIKTPTLFKHLKCGKTFYRIPGTVLAKPDSCRHCHTSKGETAVCDFVLEALGEESKSVICNGRGVLQGKELDIYIPTRKLAIEYDGLYYHSYEKLKKKEDKLGVPAQAYNEWKTNECEKRGIRLIHIFEDEWLEHQDIVEDKLRAIFHIPMHKYFARKLEVRTVSREMADRFYECNHIQGKTNVSVSVGLYNGDELLALQSFLPYTRKRAENTWELVRYATKLGTQVVGGFSRCLKWFERNYTPKGIVSFADKRWCDPFSNVYESAGFIKDGEVPRTYWYVQGQKRFHKFGFRKDRIRTKYPEIYSPEKTEAEMAKELGLQRIYDCGLIRYHKLY
jgi:hypothetical protein